MRPHIRPLIACFYALCTLLTVVSCSTDDPVDPGTAIHQSYEMEYDVARNRTTGRAAIRAENDAGPQLQAATPSGLLYNSIPMPWSNTEPYGYEQIQSGRHESGIFEFTDPGGIVRVNSASLSAVEEIALPADVNELLMDTQVDIIWQGAALGTGETVSLIFNTPSNGLVAFYQETPGTTFITLTPDDVTALGAGTATWRLERVRYFDLQAPLAGGGRIGVKWSTGDMPITIK